MALLGAASHEKADIVLIQEPSILSQTERRSTKWHETYNTLTSWQNWDTLPRVMTYTRRAQTTISFDLAPIPSHPDVMAIDIIAPSLPNLRLFNLYNAGPSSERTG
jgi:hypothetical protein